MTPIRTRARRLATLAACAGLAAIPLASRAADHLDTPTVIADPSADIGDVYAWTSSEERRLNLVMTLVGKRFSDRLQYVFHVDSGEAPGTSTASTNILCRFDVAQTAECWAGEADYARGHADHPAGIEGANRRFRVFAGLRNDPFFNNVRGARDSWEVVRAALERGVATDAAGCPAFDANTAAAIRETWAHTAGGPPADFLAGWTAAALVVSVDLDVVDAGGSALAVYGTVRAP